MKEEEEEEEAKSLQTGRGGGRGEGKRIDKLNWWGCREPRGGPLDWERVEIQERGEVGRREELKEGGGVRRRGGRGVRLGGRGGVFDVGEGR
jgi:hypothetical protein